MSAIQITIRAERNKPEQTGMDGDILWSLDRGSERQQAGMTPEFFQDAIRLIVGSGLKHAEPCDCWACERALQRMRAIQGILEGN